MQADGFDSGDAGGPSRRTMVDGLAGITVVPRRVLGGSGYQAPSDTLNLAGIGVGGYHRPWLGERLRVMPRAETAPHASIVTWDFRPAAQRRRCA